MTERPGRKPSRRTLPGRTPTLGRQAWIDAALGALSAEGVAGARVELLARKLNITKGSFYHHFDDRDDLHAAMLEHWRQHMVLEVISDLERVSDPRERFRRLLRLPFDDRVADLDVEFAVRLWARTDRRASAALQQVDELRLDYLRRVIVACGVPSRLAPARALLTFALLRAAPRFDKVLYAQCEALLIGNGEH